MDENKELTVDTQTEASTEEQTTDIDRKRAWTVKSLNGDGSISITTTATPKAEYFILDKDIDRIEPVKNASEPQKLADNEVRLDGVVYKIVKK
ncbi:hypothetical protein [Aerococcus vaginalis]